MQHQDIVIILRKDNLMNFLRAGRDDISGLNH